MYTIDDMYEKFMDMTERDDNGCLIWTGRTNNTGHPIHTIDRMDENKQRKVTTFNVRKFVFESFGNVVSTRYLYNSCGNKLCINPEHIVNYTEDIRFWRYVEKEENGCWNWTGDTATNGYGRITLNNGDDAVSVHRYSFEKFSGVEIPDDLFVLHSCNNKRCVNPAHLRVGTHKDNMRDMANSNILKGENNPKALLNPNQVREIRQLIKERMVTYQKISERYGVSRQAIKDIASGRTWKWVE